MLQYSPLVSIEPGSRSIRRRELQLGWSRLHTTSPRWAERSEDVDLLRNRTVEDEATCRDPGGAVLVSVSVDHLV